jgi:biopolymer transport protein TolR
MAGSSAQILASGRRRRRGSRRRPLSEINVTPLVDVMLVLLIVFMIAAPLLTAGVPVELPKTEASALDDQSEPLTVTIGANGSLFVQDRPVVFAELAPRMLALTAGAAPDGSTRPVFVRADGKAPYETVARVMASLSASGFRSIGLITDIGGPSSGIRPNDALTAGGPAKGQ